MKMAIIFAASMGVLLSLVRQPHKKYIVEGKKSMMEKLYQKMNSIGISSIVMGIVTIAVGIGAGVLMIVNGARLLASKKDITF